MRIAAFIAIVALFVVGVTTTRISMPASAADCDPNYIGACVPNNAASVTCDQIKAQVTVANVDVYGLDSDGDGIGCEKYATAAQKAAAAKTGSPSTAGAAKDGGTSCSTIFVAGKGVIDSCSNGHKDTARVYPRKAGIPANGCADTCPQPVDTTAKPIGTQGPSAASTPTGTLRDFATPVPTDNTEAPVIPQATPQNCDRVSYPDICVPAAPPYFSCSDIPDRNFRVRAPDPHRFDADGNGIGCEQVAGPTIGR